MVAAAFPGGILVVVEALHAVAQGAAKVEVHMDSSRHPAEEDTPWELGLDVPEGCEVAWTVVVTPAFAEHSQAAVVVAVVADAVFAQ